MQAGGVQPQPGMCRSDLGRPLLPAAPRPGVQGPRAGPYLQQHPRAAPGPLSPLSDLAATWPESQHVRWVTRCRFRHEPVVKGARNAKLTPPSCKASSCVR